MKVLMIGSDRDIFREGSDSYLRMREYGGLFEELHIVVFARGNDQTPNSKLQISGGRIQIRENVWVYPTKSWSRWFYVRDGIKIALKIVKEKKTDSKQDGEWVVTTQDPFEAGLAGWMVKGRLGIPWQAQIHTDFLSPFFKRQSVLNRVRVWIAKIILPKADKARVVSMRIKKSLLLNRLVKEERVEVLPIFINTKSFLAEPKTRDLKKEFSAVEFIIFMASRLTPEKNIRHALGAMKGVIRKYPKTLLVIAGEGILREGLEKEVRSWGLKGNVVFLGNLDKGGLAGCYASADMFLLTSVYEGYGRTVTEAMAFGCPVVMTDVGIAGEIMKNRENGLVVPVGNRILLQKAIIEMIEKPEERKRMGEEGRRAVEELPLFEEYLQKFKNSLNFESPDF